MKLLFTQFRAGAYSRLFQTNTKKKKKSFVLINVTRNHNNNNNHIILYRRIWTIRHDIYISLFFFFSPKVTETNRNIND